MAWDIHLYRIAVRSKATHTLRLMQLQANPTLLARLYPKSALTAERIPNWPQTFAQQGLDYAHYTRYTPSAGDRSDRFYFRRNPAVSIVEGPRQVDFFLGGAKESALDGNILVTKCQTPALFVAQIGSITEAFRKKPTSFVSWMGDHQDLLALASRLSGSAFESFTINCLKPWTADTLVELRPARAA